MTGDLVDLAALGPDGEYRTRNREIIKDTAGAAGRGIIRSCQGYSCTGRSTRSASCDPLPAAEREAALTRGRRRLRVVDDRRTRLRQLRRAHLPGVRPADGRGPRGCPHRRRIPHHRMRRRASGPAVGCETRLARAEHAAGGAVWARRGEVLAVHAPGNAPGVHGLWPQALALGYRVAIRPSRREPFTAHRLIHALRQTGFRDGRRAVPADRPHRRRRCHPGGRPGHGLRRPGRRRQSTHRIRGCSPTGRAAPRS